MDGVRLQSRANKDSLMSLDRRDRLSLYFTTTVMVEVWLWPPPAAVMVRL